MRPQDLIGPNVYRHLTEAMASTPELASYRLRTDIEGGGIEFFMEDDIVNRVVALPDSDVWSHSQTYAGLLAVNRWLLDGPKLFLAKDHECLAMEQVDLNINQADYHQPYPCVAVAFPRGMYHPFTGCLSFANDDLLIGFLCGEHPVSAYIVRAYAEHRRMEDMIHTFGENVRQWQGPGSKAFRVAFNLCLALANFGCQAELLYPKDVERDRRLAQENSDRGARARARLPLAVQRLSFSQDVKLHKDERPGAARPHLGGSVTTHWRRGHWAMQPFGEKQSQRKRIFRRPVLVRADLFTGDMAKSSTTYRT